MGELKYRIGRFPELPARRVCAPGTCGKAESRAGGAPGIAHFLFLLVLAFALWRVVFCMRSYAPPRARGGFVFCSRYGAGFDPSARLAGARFALLKNRSDFTFAAKGFSAFSISRFALRIPARGRAGGLGVFCRSPRRPPSPRFFWPVRILEARALKNGARFG